MFAEARPDLSLSSAEKAANLESKENDDPTEVASDGVRLYTFQLTSYLNGHEVPKDEPVDFASVPLEHLPLSTSTSSNAKEITKEGQAEEANESSSKSAFQNFLTTRENAELDASSEADERRLSDIIWSIKYKISESRDQNQVIKALKKLRELQMTFSKYVLLPEGLPPQIVSSIVGKKSKQGKEQDSKKIEKSNKDDLKQDNVAKDDSSAESERTDSTTYKGDSLLSKWATFKPRSGVRYTYVNPIVSTIFNISSELTRNSPSMPAERILLASLHKSED